MNRRLCLQSLAAAAVGVAADLALDPERALWVPGRKRIFLPTPPGELVTRLGEQLQKGDVFTIAGLYAHNPQTGALMPYLQQFVVTKDATPDRVDLAIVHPRPEIVGRQVAQSVGFRAALAPRDRGWSTKLV